MERDGEGGEPKDARVYSAKTREFAAPQARSISKKAGRRVWERDVQGSSSPHRYEVRPE